MLDDPTGKPQPKKLLLCSGKVYYDLLAEREKRKTERIVIVRLEQLYPLNMQRLQELLQKYAGCAECLWVQEEHSNMGAWEYWPPLLNRSLARKMPPALCRKRAQRLSCRRLLRAAQKKPAAP